MSFHWESWFEECLACPRDASRLESKGSELLCPLGHRYPVVDGIPVLLRDDVKQTQWVADASLQAAQVGFSPSTQETPSDAVDPFVQEAVAATCGYLYVPAIGSMRRYPIPALRLPPSQGSVLVDAGCNWGRWTVSAARRGYRVIGVDPNLDAVMAARRVARQLQIDAAFVVGDARYLPFATNSVDVVFSYSVIQHFSKDDARLALAAFGRVLRPGGTSLVQMPNRFGVRCLYHQARRGFREGEEFDVRYWSPQELMAAFEAIIGPSSLSVDGFFGLGIQPADLDVLPSRYRWVVRASEALRRLSLKVSLLARFADSLYVTSSHRQPGCS